MFVVKRTTIAMELTMNELFKLELNLKMYFRPLYNNAYK